MKVQAERGVSRLASFTRVLRWSKLIGAEGVKVLAECGLAILPKFTPLLPLSKSIAAESVKVLAERGLPSVTNLTSLNVGGNSIGAEGATVLVKLFSTNVLSLLTHFIGFDLRDHAAVLLLPQGLETASNRSILSFLHERAKVREKRLFFDNPT